MEKIEEVLKGSYNAGKNEVINEFTTKLQHYQNIFCGPEAHYCKFIDQRIEWRQQHGMSVLPCGNVVLLPSMIKYITYYFYSFLSKSLWVFILFKTCYSNGKENEDARRNIKKIKQKNCS